MQFGLPIAVWTPQQVQALLSSKGTERYCPQKVDSSSGCAFRQASGFHKNLSHATPNHPAPHRNGALKHDPTETIHEIHSRRPYLREPPPSADGETVHRCEASQAPGTSPTLPQPAPSRAYPPLTLGTPWALFPSSPLLPDVSLLASSFSGSTLLQPLLCRPFMLLAHMLGFST